MFLKRPNAHKSTPIHDSVTDDAHAGLSWCLRERGRIVGSSGWTAQAKCEQTAGIAKKKNRGGKRTMANHSQTDSHTDTHSSETLKNIH